MTSSVAVERQADPEWSQGDRFRKVRVQAGYTQRDFADALEVKHATYAAWEADRTTCPRIQAVARRIEVLTGIRAAWTLGVADPMPPAPSDGPSSRGGAESSTHRNSTGYVDAVLLHPDFRRSRSEVVATATTAVREGISA